MAMAEMQEKLNAFALECFADPLKFVKGAFPWGDCQLTQKTTIPARTG